MVQISCSAPYGKGGLGQHLAEVVEQHRIDGELGCYYATEAREADDCGRKVDTRWTDLVLRATPIRFSPGWQNFISGDLFDRSVAGMVKCRSRMVAFNGQALHTFRKVRSRGRVELVLESATVHVNHVLREQAASIGRWPIESGWLNEAQARKTLAEYEMADVIYVGSELSRDTFLAEGIAENKIRKRQLNAHPRFTPAKPAFGDGLFRIVYVGSLSVMKGVPLLLEVFRNCTNRDARLILVGGWGTRGMRRYVQEKLSQDSRITVCPGDPLPYLQSCNVCVHPSYTDGFGYAPMEALACGIPVIVSDNTGMKEHVRNGENGYVVRTGDSDELAEAMARIMDNPLVIAKT